MECDGTRWRTVGEVKGETGEWSGYPVPYTQPRSMVYPALLPLMRTPRLPVVDWTDAPPTPPFKWNCPFRRKTKSRFLRVCHHVSNVVYKQTSSPYHFAHCPTTMYHFYKHGESDSTSVGNQVLLSKLPSVSLNISHNNRTVRSRVYKYPAHSRCQ